eukprot:scaffold17184_cov44-Cyclotella_meneghiniana.AAC.1
MGEIVGRRGGRWRQLATAMDSIRWRRFMEGMIPKVAVMIQSETEDASSCRPTVKAWSAGLVVKLLEVTHGQWLYRNVHVHDIISGEKARNRKESGRSIRTTARLLLVAASVVEVFCILVVVKLNSLKVK